MLVGYKIHVIFLYILMIHRIPYVFNAILSIIFVNCVMVPNYLVVNYN